MKLLFSVIYLNAFLNNFECQKSALVNQESFLRENIMMPKQISQFYNEIDKP